MDVIFHGRSTRGVPSEASLMEDRGRVAFRKVLRPKPWHCRDAYGFDPDFESFGSKLVDLVRQHMSDQGVRGPSRIMSSDIERVQVGQLWGYRLLPRRFAGTSGATFYIFTTTDGQHTPRDGAHI
jgi:hypothetical protein